MGQTTEIGLQHWLNISEQQWQLIIEVCKCNSLKLPQKRKKRDHQKLAINNAREHFLKGKNKRGKLIMPCGTGKSLIAYWSAQILESKSIIIAVPSLALIKQSLEDWTSEYLAEAYYLIGLQFVVTIVLVR